MKLNRTTGFVATIAILMLTACGNKEQATEQAPEKIKVQVEKVNEREIDQLGTFTGTVESEVVNNIAPQTAMRIKKVFVEVGDHVVAGQKMAEMDAVNLNQRQLQMENDRAEFERVDELYKVGGISKSTWDARKLAYDVSKTAYENLLENTMLRSPIGGLVTKRNYDSGDMYSGAQPIYVVEQINPVKLIVNVSEVLFTKVSRGMHVEVLLDAFSGEAFDGVVIRIHPTIDPATRTFPVEIQIKNGNERILPGMFARATFNYGKQKRVMVPDRAILKQAGAADRYVYVCQDGEAHYRKVILGQLIGNEYEVLEGLSNNETVAITALSRLNNGTLIEIMNN